jgi:hypothetical protein
MSFLVDLVIIFHFCANLVKKNFCYNGCYCSRAFPASCLFYDAISSAIASYTNFDLTCKHYFKNRVFQVIIKFSRLPPVSILWKIECWKSSQFSRVPQLTHFWQVVDGRLWHLRTGGWSLLAGCDEWLTTWYGLTLGRVLLVQVVAWFALVHVKSRCERS